MSYLHTSIATALNTVRTQRYYERKRQEKLKQFDNLPPNEKQRLFIEYKGRKLHICHIREWDKLRIIEQYLNK